MNKLLTVTQRSPRRIGVALFFACSVVAAQELAPDVMIKEETQAVLAIIKQDKDIQSGNFKKSVELIEQRVAPAFNFLRMTQLAVGKFWDKASAQQRSALAGEFRSLLVRTYANALANFKDYTIVYKPFRAREGDTRVVVKTQVNQPSGEPVPIDYSLETGPSGWKVYDVSVGGVSLVISYRENFAMEIRNNGIDGLIAALQKKNQQLQKK
jgi:phospholipid transport system substrate-binding protein